MFCSTSLVGSESFPGFTVSVEGQRSCAPSVSKSYLLAIVCLPLNVCVLTSEVATSLKDDCKRLCSVAEEDCSDTGRLKGHGRSAASVPGNVGDVAGV